MNSFLGPQPEFPRTQIVYHPKSTEIHHHSKCDKKTYFCLKCCVFVFYLRTTKVSNVKGFVLDGHLSMPDNESTML